MHRSILASLLGMVCAAMVLPGCEPSRAEVICEITCACQHCNDQAKVDFCNKLETTQEVATAYGCSNAWEAYTLCVEERGTCDEVKSQFTVRNEINENRCQDTVVALDSCMGDASAHEGVNTRFE